MGPRAEGPSLNAACWSHCLVHMQVKWTWRVKDAEGDEVLAQPANLSKQDFVNQLALMFDGGFAPLCLLVWHLMVGWSPLTGWPGRLMVKSCP